MRQVELLHLALLGCGGELAVLHVCKLPPEENKMVPCVKLQLRGLHFRDLRSILVHLFSMRGTQWEFAKDQFSIG